MPFTPETASAAGSKPKKRTFITQQIISQLNEVNSQTKASRVATLVGALLDKACEGDVSAIREVIDRVEGKVTQPHGGDEDNPLEIIHRLERVIVRPPTSSP